VDPRAFFMAGMLVLAGTALAAYAQVRPPAKLCPIHTVSSAAGLACAVRG